MLIDIEILMNKEKGTFFILDKLSGKTRNIQKNAGYLLGNFFGGVKVFYDFQQIQNYRRQVAARVLDE